MNRIDHFLTLLPTNMTSEAITMAVRQIETEDIVFETNAGTFSAEECLEAKGTGDPSFGTYQRIMNIGTGQITIIGCDPQGAPGYPRRPDTWRRLDAKLKEMRQVLVQRSEG